MKPTLPQGTRDFSAAVVHKRNYIIKTIKTVFELYGFEPLETPSMENLDTLMGKYGDEGDKLIFKILNNGLDNAAKHDLAEQDFKKVLLGKSVKGITERALRYDLTIPFARFIAMNHAQLIMPFKRYQIQPVWRADRPQKGRYREFYQCDVDVVGSKSLLNEVELTSIYSEVFTTLGIPVKIKINSRKILAALAELCGGKEKFVEITVAIDKLDKIGLDKVKEELLNKGVTEQQVEIVENYLRISGTNAEKIELVKQLFSDNQIAKEGIGEVEYILEYLPTLNDQQVVVDLTLARGLSYYTGIIFEVKAENVQIGSIGGGGRYDNLTSLFGVEGITGVGVSFGLDRIYDVLEELQLFPTKIAGGSKVLFFNLGVQESKTAFNLMQLLRSKKVPCEIYPDNAKFDRQFKFADRKRIPYVIIIGSKELEDRDVD